MRRQNIGGEELLQQTDGKEKYMRLPILPLILLVFAARPVIAGPLEDGAEAFQKGDYPTALRLWRTLAEQGDACAQFNLGHMYRTGLGVPQDYQQAMFWDRQSAERGNAAAEFNLGVSYYNGQGVPQDYVLAHVWLSLSAIQGDADAVRHRNRVVTKMTPEQIKRAERLATDWKPKPVH